MRGSIREKRPGIWEIMVELPPDPVSGKRRRKWATVSGSKRKAQFELQKMLVGAKDAKARASSASVEHVINEWFGLARQNLTAQTAQSYETRIRTQILPELGAIPVDELSPLHIETLCRSLLDRGLAPAGVRFTYAILRRALNQAVKWGWLETNPAMRATPPRLPQRELASITVDQLATLIRDAEALNPQWASMIILSAVSGLRRGELLGLKWSDLGTDSVTVRRSMGYTPKVGVYEGTTKTRQTRRVALDPIGMAVVARQMEEIRSASEQVGIELCSDPFLFSAEPDGSKAFHPDSISKVFRRVADTHGWRELHFHSLRHFSATEMIAAGVDIRTVAARLGHSDPSITLRVYAHALPERDRAAAELLGSRLRLPSAEDSAES